jgi:hypothetical protein
MEGNDCISSFVWRDTGKPRRTAVGIINVSAEIRTAHLPSTAEKRYSLRHLAQ